MAWRERSCDPPPLERVTPSEERTLATNTDSTVARRPSSPPSGGFTGRHARYHHHDRAHREEDRSHNRSRSRGHGREGGRGRGRGRGVGRSVGRDGSSRGRGRGRGRFSVQGNPWGIEREEELLPMSEETSRVRRIKDEEVRKAWREEQRQKQRLREQRRYADEHEHSVAGGSQVGDEEKKTPQAEGQGSNSSSGSSSRGNEATEKDAPKPQGSESPPTEARKKRKSSDIPPTVEGEEEEKEGEDKVSSEKTKKKHKKKHKKKETEGEEENEIEPETTKKRKRKKQKTATCESEENVFFQEMVDAEDELLRILAEHSDNSADQQTVLREKRDFAKMIWQSMQTMDQWPQVDRVRRERQTCLEEATNTTTNNKNESLIQELRDALTTYRDSLKTLLLLRKQK